MAKKKSAIPGLSFSWKRATGISSAKRKSQKQQASLPQSREDEIK